MLWVIMAFFLFPPSSCWLVFIVIPILHLIFWTWCVTWWGESHLLVYFIHQWWWWGTSHFHCVGFFIWVTKAMWQVGSAAFKILTMRYDVFVCPNSLYIMLAVINPSTASSNNPVKSFCNIFLVILVIMLPLLLDLLVLWALFSRASHIRALFL